MASYQELYQEYIAKAQQLQKRLNWLSFSRLALFVLFLFLAYRSSQTSNGFAIFLTIASLVAFFLVVRWYDRLEQKTVYYKALVKFNQDEIDFLETNISSYPNGKEFENAHHPYSYDLDIFGHGGLFSYLNRCSTPFGREALVSALLHPSVKAIPHRQQAIAELAGKTTFRQQMYAYGSLSESKDKDLNKLMAWIKNKQSYINNPLYFLLMLFPAITIGSLVYYFLSENELAFRLFYSSFILNLFISAIFAKKIISQLSVSTSVTKILQAYKDQLKLIEKEPFHSPLLQELQNQLQFQGSSASVLLSRLAALFEYLETVINLLVSILLNGLFLFHIHILYRLGNWKKAHAEKIIHWLQLIGEIESLNSLANLAANNPTFIFPDILDRPALQAIALGHPLIKAQNRICNDVSFNSQKFIILTGSNMSGKSTFLRTLGINLVLARAGAAVCANGLQFYPFDVFVSMRISDSLQDSESFFYAELKRLQAIIRHVQDHKTFVILDEILRGTNSNDKRNGTIGLIKKLSKENTFGIIATHDVVVADLIQDYPQYISNKAFESEIINDELIFDYKLKDGVCTKLSASYLLKKMGVID